jgi:hypothetical protein
MTATNLRDNDGSRRKAQSLEGRNLLALRCHNTTKRYVEQECSNTEKYVGNCYGHHFLLLQFVVEKAVRRLVAPGEGAYRAVGLKQSVELVYHRLRIRTSRKRDDDVVESTNHVKRRLGGRAIHPKDCVVTIIGDQKAGLDRVDVFRRQRDPGNAKGLDTAIEDNPQIRPRHDAVGLRERFIDHSGTGIARLRGGATSQIKAIERFIPTLCQRDHPGRNRKGR